MEEKIKEISYLYELVMKKDQLESEIENLFCKHISNEAKQELFKDLFEQLCFVTEKIQSAHVFLNDESEALCLG